MNKLNFNFDSLAPQLSNQQMHNHYEGHYLKYIEKTNNIINNNAKGLDKFNVHNLFFVLSIKNAKYFGLIKSDLNIISQTYFHEIFFNGLVQKSQSIQMFNLYKDQLFGSNDNFNKFYNDYTTISNKHFASGWIWFVRDPINGVIVMDSQDAELPAYNIDILMCIDVWEHGFASIVEKYGLV